VLLEDFQPEYQDSVLLTENLKLLPFSTITLSNVEIFVKHYIKCSFLFLPEYYLLSNA